MLLDQELEATGRRVGVGIGGAIEVTRFPAAMAFERLGRVRAECR